MMMESDRKNTNGNRQPSTCEKVRPQVLHDIIRAAFWLAWAKHLASLRGGCRFILAGASPEKEQDYIQSKWPLGVRWKSVGCVWQLVERKSSDFKWGGATVTPAMPHGLLGSWKVALILQIRRQRGRPTLTGGEKGKSKWALMSARLAAADSSEA